jgi:RHS repeat-associated protein
VTKADSSVNTSDRSYEYDAIGNRKKTANSLTLPTANNYTANALNQYSTLSINGTSAAISPAYDLDGNMTSGPLPVAPTVNSAVTWDAENRMLSTTVGTTTSYQYDANSRRIAKTTGANASIYIYDNWNCIAEYKQSGTATAVLAKTRLWGKDLSNTLQGAGGVGGLLSETQIADGTATKYYPTYDGNGNISEYLAANGAPAAHYEYDPFGNTVVNTDATGQFAYRFSTKPLDAETGYYYYGYRSYDPLTGRWVSRDPIEEAGDINLLSFVQNNGGNFFDNLGRKTCPKETEQDKKDAKSAAESEAKDKFTDSASYFIYSTTTVFLYAHCGDPTFSVECDCSGDKPCDCKLKASVKCTIGYAVKTRLGWKPPGIPGFPGTADPGGISVPAGYTKKEKEETFTSGFTKTCK